METLCLLTVFDDCCCCNWWWEDELEVEDEDWLRLLAPIWLLEVFWNFIRRWSALPLFKDSLVEWGCWWFDLLLWWTERCCSFDAKFIDELLVCWFSWRWMGCESFGDKPPELDENFGARIARIDRCLYRLLPLSLVSVKVRLVVVAPAAEPSESGRLVGEFGLLLFREWSWVG